MGGYHGLYALQSSTEGRYKPRPRRVSLHELTNNNAGRGQNKALLGLFF